jgi:hypothetical protein
MGCYLMMCRPLRNFIRNMCMVSVFLLVTDNKELMTPEAFLVCNSRL